MSNKPGESKLADILYMVYHNEISEKECMTRIKELLKERLPSRCIGSNEGPQWHNQLLEDVVKMIDSL